MTVRGQGLAYGIVHIYVFGRLALVLIGLAAIAGAFLHTITGWFGWLPIIGTHAELIGEMVVAVAIAHLLREGTHFAFAWALHREPSIGFSLTTGFFVDHIGPAQLTLEDWTIHAAPVVIGLSVGLWWVARIGTPELPFIVAWAVYTLVGAPNDLRFREIDKIE